MICLMQSRKKTNCFNNCNRTGDFHQNDGGAEQGTYTIYVIQKEVSVVTRKRNNTVLEVGGIKQKTVLVCL